MKTILKEIDDAQAAYAAAMEAKRTQDMAAAFAGERVKRLRQQLADAITEGCVPCSGCGAQPHGMLQPNRGGAGQHFEIGCLNCTDPRPRTERPQGKAREAAVEQWNAEQAEAAP